MSLGVPAVFLFGGVKRKERPQRVGLEHGDVVVWGGPARLPITASRGSRNPRIRSRVARGSI